MIDECRYCGRTAWPFCMNTRDMEDNAIAGVDRCFKALEQHGWGEAGEQYVRLNREKLVPLHPPRRKGCVAVVIFARNAVGGGADLRHAWMFSATDEDKSAVLQNLIKREQPKGRGWYLAHSLVDEIRPDVMRKALGLEGLADE